MAGDWLLVTGSLGGSLAGRHLTFTPRLNEAMQLHAATRLHAMLDLSDGVASDVRHLLRGGRLGCVIDGAAVPIHPDVDAAVGVHASACPAERPSGTGTLKAELQQDERLRRALCDGEDFELLLAVSPEDGEHLLKSPPPGTALWRIGDVTGDGQRLLRAADGSVQPLMSGGWEHAVS
jgi:thiamine-monophosphate kinase